jgi:hypothetical protein
MRMPGSIPAIKWHSRIAEQCPWAGIYYPERMDAASIRKLPERWQWCTDHSGEYVECAEVWLCSCYHLSVCIPCESQSLLNDRHTITAFVWTDTGKARKSSVGIAVLQAKIWTWDLLNMKEY